MTKYRTIGGCIGSVVAIGKALASPIRVRALLALKVREMCLCELEELFGIAPSTISRHMSVLAAVGLVQSRRDSRWTYYRLPEATDGDVAAVLRLVSAMAGDDPIVRQDSGHSKAVVCR